MSARGCNDRHSSRSAYALCIVPTWPAVSQITRFLDATDPAIALYSSHCSIRPYNTFVNSHDRILGIAPHEISRFVLSVYEPNGSRTPDRAEE